jgi:hypothetical protein
MKAHRRPEAIGAALPVIILATTAFADPWRQGEPRALQAPRQLQSSPAGELNQPGIGFSGSAGALHPSVLQEPGVTGMPRSRGTTRAVEARGEPIVVRL